MLGKIYVFDPTQNKELLGELNRISLKLPDIASPISNIYEKQAVVFSDTTKHIKSVTDEVSKICMGLCTLAGLVRSRTFEASYLACFTQNPNFDVTKIWHVDTSLFGLQLFQANDPFTSSQILVSQDSATDLFKPDLDPANIDTKTPVFEFTFDQLNLANLLLPTLVTGIFEIDLEKLMSFCQLNSDVKDRLAFAYFGTILVGRLQHRQPLENPKEFVYPRRITSIVFEDPNPITLQ